MIFHTDSAKAYRKVGDLQFALAVWRLSVLDDTFDTNNLFAEDASGHTNVTHQKKGGQPTHYTALPNVHFLAEPVKQYLGGT